MGTPEFAARILEGLLASSDVRVLCVYTQPDRPAGRGNKLLAPPVKALALERGLPVRQPETFRSGEAQAELASLAPDFLVVAAYGMILPQTVLDIPRCASINVHTSLLPAYRGSAPVQRAIMDGVPVTGVSVMRMEAGLDTGPVYSRIEMSTAGETAGSLLNRMAAAAVPQLLDVLNRVREGALEPVPQTGESCYAAKIAKAEGHLDVYRPVERVDCHLRGVTPDPGAHVTLELQSGDVSVLLEEVRVVKDRTGEPGSVLARKGLLLLACEGGCLSVLRLKPQGKKSMDAAAFLNGLRLNGPELVQVGRVRPLDANGD
ncbi:MAG: methionyl-tRNA formyltransferase [Desulfovibrionaceae bacterium]|nr:methionyl-tRNA formyltransferase [Desulfovibrionaceae bacterium]